MVITSLITLIFGDELSDLKAVSLVWTLGGSDFGKEWIRIASLPVL